MVDDCSNEKNRLEEKLKKYNFKITLIRLEKQNKFYTNPCIPFNIGFEHAQGDIILIQNPECFHMGQVLQKASTINDNDYLVFSCYNLDKILSEKIRNDNNNEIDFSKINASLVPLINRAVTHCEETAWYNHPIFIETIHVKQAERDKKAWEADFALLVTTGKRRQKTFGGLVRIS